VTLPVVVVVEEEEEASGEAHPGLVVSHPGSTYMPTKRTCFIPTNLRRGVVCVRQDPSYLVYAIHLITNSLHR
jgi:hypothetical protein